MPDLKDRHEELRECRFRAMNTDISIMARSDASTMARIDSMGRDWFRYAENIFSRFLDNSELQSLNRAAGERCLVSDAMLEVLLLAEHYHEATEGVFNPLVGEAMRRTGYDGTFETVRGGKKLDKPLTAMTCGKFDLRIDSGMKAVLLPRGKEIDLGGIVKSWSVKRLAGFFRKQMPIASGLINAGGDLTAWNNGNSPADGPWKIGIENPHVPDKNVAVLILAEGAAATSSKLGRQWETNRGRMHHLIDPQTMLPGDSDTLQCTVAGPDPVTCEIWSKTLCITGSVRGFPLFSRKAPGYQAVLFNKDRKVIFFGNNSDLAHKWKDLVSDAVREPGT